MRRLIIWSFVIMAWSISPSSGWSAQRDPDEILRELDATPIPKPSETLDRKSFREFMDERERVLHKRARLIVELFHAKPDHRQLIELFPIRWEWIVTTEPATVDREASEVLSRSTDPVLVGHAAYYKAYASIMAASTLDTIPKPVESFLEREPDDERGGKLLLLIATNINASIAERKRILDRIVEGYPASREARKAESSLRRLDAIGSPFILEFTDMMTGKRISIEEMDGKIVVIDFWASWSAASVAELARLHRLYAKYHDQGVEFIGVNLDKPDGEEGVARLKAFVADNEIGWPQYCVPDGSQRAYAHEAGVDSIPMQFVVAPDGVLYSTEARGKLDTMIPELINRRNRERSLAGSRQTAGEE